VNSHLSETLVDAARLATPDTTDAFVRCVKISTDARIASGVRFGTGVTIHEGVEIAEGVEIGDRVTLRNCRLGPGVRIEDNCVIGYQTVTGGFSHIFAERTDIAPTVLGPETLVRTGSVLYQSVTVGGSCWINHMVLLREHTRIGDHTCIGSMTDSEGYNSIGSHVSIHSQVQLCARLTIEDYVFIAPMTVFANGSPMNYARNFESIEAGPVVHFGVQIAVNSVIMPRVEIGYECVIGPSSVVNKDVPSLSVVMGYPARVISRVTPEQRMPIEIRRLYYGGGAEPPQF
jgi:acetyltransferase-like isoleucine patch superfamily enzyme